jgi:hypothetical protein
MRLSRLPQHDSAARHARRPRSAVVIRRPCDSGRDTRRRCAYVGILDRSRLGGTSSPRWRMNASSPYAPSRLELVRRSFRQEHRLAGVSPGAGRLARATDSPACSPLSWRPRQSPPVSEAASTVVGRAAEILRPSPRVVGRRAGVRGKSPRWPRGAGDRQGDVWASRSAGHSGAQRRECLIPKKRQ